MKLRVSSVTFFPISCWARWLRFERDANNASRTSRGRSWLRSVRTTWKGEHRASRRCDMRLDLLPTEGTLATSSSSRPTCAAGSGDVSCNMQLYPSSSSTWLESIFSWSNSTYPFGERKEPTRTRASTSPSSSSSSSTTIGGKPNLPRRRWQTARVVALDVNLTAAEVVVAVLDGARNRDTVLFERFEWEVPLDIDGGSPRCFGEEGVDVAKSWM
mmetsp:Transcript_18635/g.43642  ORF Transcript_18635/g.43642 Transcript_18635/m.43642 type:complete len:215 (-) Transcript_18635:245-889(-)